MYFSFPPWFLVSCSAYLLCDKISWWWGGCNTYIYSPYVGISQSTKVQIPPSPTWWAKLGSGDLQDHQLLKGSCVTKAHRSMGDSSQTLGTWSTLHSLQASQQVGQCPFQVTRVDTSSRQLCWFLLLPGSWSGLRVFCSSASLCLRGHLRFCRLLWRTGA